MTHLSMGYYTVVKNNEEALHVLLCSDHQDILLRQPNAEPNVENAPTFGIKETLKCLLAYKSMKYLWEDISRSEITFVTIWEGNHVVERLG